MIYKNLFRVIKKLILYTIQLNLFSAFLNNESIVNENGLQLKSVERILEDKNGNILKEFFAESL